MPTITTHNFFVKRGDTFRQKISVYRDGEPADITGWTIYFTLKKEKTDADSDAVIKKVITEHFSPEKGETILLCYPSETKNLLGVYYYDIQIKRHITDPTDYDDIATPLEGTITFSEDITREI